VLVSRLYNIEMCSIASTLVKLISETSEEATGFLEFCIAGGEIPSDYSGILARAYDLPSIELELENFGGWWDGRACERWSVEGIESGG
jgi:hypothetical protein